MADTNTIVEPCGFCGEEIQAEQKRTELMCDHSFHTECFLRMAARENYMANVRCNACDAHVVPNEMIEEAETVHSTEASKTSIQHLFETEEGFRNDLLNIRTAHKAATTATAAYNKAKANIVKEFKTGTTTFINILKNKIKDAKGKLRALPEHKVAMRASTAYVAASRKLQRRWGLGYRAWMVRNALSDIKDKSSHPVSKYMPPDGIVYRRRRGMSRFREFYITLR